MRNVLLLLHRYCGLASLAFLAIAGLTGCFLTLREPIDHALNPDLFGSSTSRSVRPAMAIAAVSRFAASQPRFQVTGFPLNLPAGEAMPVNVVARPGASPVEATQWFIDPAGGKVLGARSDAPGWDARHLVAGVAQLHFNLLAGEPGRLLLGAIAAAWFGSIIAGLVLTLPQRAPFWRQWRRIWRLRRSSPFPRLLLDLHRASGLWLLPFLLVLAFTSVAINFWAEWYAPMASRISPLKRDLFSQEAPFPDGAVPRLGFGDALALAKAQAAREGLEWQPATMLYLPEWNLYGVKFAQGGSLNYRKLGPVDYYFDGDTGRFKHKVDPYDDSAGLVMMRMIYPLHSGETAGIPGVALVFLLGIVTFGQSLTGAYIWWKKRRSRIAHKRSQRQRNRAGPA